MSSHNHNQSETHQESNLPNQSIWILDPSSSLYWNSHQRIWARPDKDEIGGWKYVDEKGNPIESTSINPKTLTKSRSIVKYEDVSDGEDGEVKASSHETNTTKKESREPINLPSLRLRVIKPHRTKSIPECQTILILNETESPITIGRDRTFNSSLRLKEMEVSKTHVTFFTNLKSNDDDDQDQDEDKGLGWYIVDNASTLGTFLSFRIRDHNLESIRLSETKQASKPFKLSHLDQISISSPTEPIVCFEVHLHSKFPSSCESCTLLSDESNRLRLSTDPRSTTTTSSTSLKTKEEDLYAMTPQDVKTNREKKRKSEMSRLKSQFFGNPHEQRPTKKLIRNVVGSQGEEEKDVSEKEFEGNPVPTKYIDRAKLRRQTNPTTKQSQGGQERNQPIKDLPLHTSKAEEKIDPFNSESKGAILLSKMGGGDQTKMGKIIETKTMGINQAGLGSQSLIVGVESLNEHQSSSSSTSNKNDWREKAREANWKRYHGL